MKIINKNNRLLIVIIMWFVLSVIGGFYVISILPDDNTFFQPLHVYSKEVSCNVTEVKKQLIGIKISIYNKEYDIEKTFYLSGNEVKKYNEIQKGNNISCFLYTWIDGERIIDRILLLYQVL